MRTATRILASRRARRDILAAILLFSSPAFADRPQMLSGQVRPPLPLNASPSNSSIKSNPYYRSGHPSSIPSVQQASDAQPLPSQRLMPVGSAIDLQEVHKPNRQHVDRDTVDVAAPGLPEIRTNHLLRSVHRQNSNLIQTKAIPAITAGVITGFTADAVTPVAVTAGPAAVTRSVTGGQLSFVQPAQHTATRSDSGPTSVTGEVKSGEPPVIVDVRGLRSGGELVASPVLLGPVTVDPASIKASDESTLDESTLDETKLPIISERPAGATTSPEAAPIIFVLREKSAKPVEESKPVQLSFSDRSEKKSSPVTRSLSSKTTARDPIAQDTESPNATAKHSNGIESIAKDPQPAETDMDQELPPEFASTGPAANKSIVSMAPHAAASLNELPDPVRISQKVELLQVEMPKVELLAAPLPITPATPEPEFAPESLDLPPESSLSQVDVEPLITEPSEIEPVVIQPPAEVGNSGKIAVPMVDEVAVGRDVHSNIQSLEARPREITSAGSSAVVATENLAATEDLAAIETLPTMDASAPTEPRESEFSGFRPVTVQPLVSGDEETEAAPETVSPNIANAESIQPRLEADGGDVAAGSNKKLGELMQGQQPIANAEVTLVSEDPSTLSEDHVPADTVVKHDLVPKVLKANEAVLSVDPMEGIATDRAPLQGGAVLPDGSEGINGEIIGEIAGIENARLPVAVKQLPPAISRSDLADPAQTDSAVQPVQALSLGESPAAKSFGVGPFNSLSMQRGKVRSLKVGDSIPRFEIEDESICQVLRGGSNELRLIGIQSGTTRIVVHAAVSGTSKTQTIGFEIRVSEPGTQFATPLTEQCDRLNRSLNQAFPNCQVKLSVYRNHLVVDGTCDSNTTAREILRMIRKACLVPLQDQLVIQ